MAERLADLHINADVLRIKIGTILNDYPDLAEDQFLRASMLEGETEMVELLTDIHQALSDAMALRDGTKLRLDELMTRQKRMQSRVDFCRDLISSIMMTAGLKKAELPEVTISMRQGQPKLIGDPDPAEIPDYYVRIKREPDRAKIRDALERGVAVAGFTLGNAPPQLALKVK